MTRSPLFNFVFGMLAGIALGAALAVHLCTTRVQQHTDEMSQLVERIQANNDRINTTVAEIVKTDQEMTSGAMQAISYWRERDQHCEAIAKRAMAESKVQ